MRTVLAITLSLLTLPLLGEACPTDTWFEPVEASCTDIAKTKDFFITAPLKDTYLPKDNNGNVDPTSKEIIALQQLNTTGTAIILTTTNGNVLRTSAETLVTEAQITATIDLAGIAAPQDITSVQLAIPAKALYCNNALVTEETILDVIFKDAQGNNTILRTCVDQSVPIYESHVSVGKLDDTEEDDPNVAVDFDFLRRVERNLQIDAAAGRWSSTSWSARLKGSIPTNADTYHDTTSLDLSWSTNKTYFGDAVAKRFRTAYWYTAFLRPETTVVDEQNRDYVYGVRTESFLNLDRYIGVDFFRGRRPFLTLGVERVDPDKREDGAVPKNYNRGNVGLKWKFYPVGDLAVDIDFGGVYIFDDKRAEELGVAQWQKRLDITLLLFKDNEFKPFIKYSRGETPPKFEFVKEVLIGLAWDLPTK